MHFRAAAFLCLALVPSAAFADERPYCPDRPGIGTPPCTVSPGQVSVELGIGDWTLDRSSAEREDDFGVGDLLVRYGIADHAEVQVGWTMLGFSRTRDRATGEVEHRSGTGDVTLALRRNLVSPDGSGLSVAFMPYVSLPTGGQPSGAGDWGAGVLMPLSYELSDKWSLTSTTEFDAAVDQDRDGRHFAFSQVIGASLQLGTAVTATAEYQITADHDPQGHSVAHLSGLSLGWQPADDLQLDAGGNVGLDRDAPDLELYFGISRRF
ncbi:outer membrane putative beta-barrel porin/alpha-amylase [Novosphingobium sp. PhB165]|uniref:transporter n=1 Tax=Novosphingobium sp. PhB165 TaxID=2485105 RepID=UPI001051D117|nr:transporter [Novosphingobium sp. PhB165]TCM17669.1 outer membrane putative beta-barrel porin/alpha-amylase [Novosphingobium sp. PhB165]